MPPDKLEERNPSLCDKEKWFLLKYDYNVLFLPNKKNNISYRKAPFF